MIVFDASTLIGAGLKPGSRPYLALVRAADHDVFALSRAVLDEIVGVLDRPRFRDVLPPGRTAWLIEMLTQSAVWFEPVEEVHDCRDAKDAKYLELAWVARADLIISSDNDLLVLHPWRGIPILTASDYLASLAES